MKLANRTREIQLFEQTLIGAHPKRIFLIQGASGLGKTELLAQFEDCCFSRNISCASVDLKATLGIHDVLSKIRRQLGHDRFPHLVRQVQAFLLGNRVEVTDNELQGEDNQINVVLNVDPQERKDRLVELQSAFFRDLNAFRSPIVLIFDTFNEVSLDVGAWLEGSCLSEAIAVPHLYVAIAGQNVPKPTLEWRRHYHHCALEEIRNFEAWWAFSQHQGFPFGRDVVKAIALQYEGMPKDISNSLQFIAKQWHQ